MKNASYLGIAAALLLIVSCFLPFTYYPDLNENFTGFYSKQGHYGKPGIFIIFLSVISIILFLIPKIWAKWTNQVVCVLIFAYVLRTFSLFSHSVAGTDTQIKPGLICIMGFSIIILISSLLSKADIKA